MLKAGAICYAGANSIQQLAYVLLRNMTTVGVLPVLYVNAEPVFTVTGPDRKELAQTLSVLQTKSFGKHCIPFAYQQSSDLLTLWTARREAWDDALQTLGTPKGLQLFMEWLSSEYVKACNTVLLYNPKDAKTSPWDLQVKIDERQSEVEKEDRVSKMFAKYWNDAVKQVHPSAVISGEPKRNEWMWALDLLKQVSPNKITLTQPH
jgi:hypothetical protein